ncbi:hypothetical protein L1049_018307 [Liquidambar formosana]|uniref:histidine kinase n=1 Tax=Liquidambar formosana TaxID=63359 RepID=A0AAP0RA09_LIQFO
MVCEMENDHIEEMDIEGLSSMWPEDVGHDDGKQFNVERPGGDQDMLEEVTIKEEPTIVDFKRLLELTNYSERGSTQLAYLVKSWEYKQANAVRLLKEELDSLSRQREEVELKKLEILEEHRFEEERYGGDKRPVSILDEVYDIWQDVPRRRNHIVIQDRRVEIDVEYDTVVYWKQRAIHLEKLLEASTQREQMLTEKLQESINNLERQSSPVEELSQILKRADNYLHFVLQNAPVVIGHQDKELRYRFIYNHFPSFKEEDIIGRTDVEIFSGAGVKESQDFKREVLERGLPAKREITFDTPLFGSKTFLIYVEPVFSKAGETIGVNYMGMDVTDQVIGDVLRIRQILTNLIRKGASLHYTRLETAKGYDKVERAATATMPVRGMVALTLYEQGHDEVEQAATTTMLARGMMAFFFFFCADKLWLTGRTSLSKMGSAQWSHRRLGWIRRRRSSRTDIIGRTDMEIFSGAGVKESQDFKREVLERGLPAKREITFDTPLFGSKTFLIYVEPVFSKAGETIGVNYMGMDETDQVIGDILRIRPILTNLISRVDAFGARTNKKICCEDDLLNISADQPEQDPLQEEQVLLYREGKKWVLQNELKKTKSPFIVLKPRRSTGH